MYGTAGAILGAATSFGLGAMQNRWAQEQQSEARHENFLYGEMAASAADQRTRALYSDIYSPSAQMRQIQAAGLSPSVFYGGTPGQGGMSGAQGTGAAGLGTPFMPISMLEGAEIASMIAQTKKTEAETENIKMQTNIAGLEKEVKELQNTTFGNTWQLLNSSMYREDGTPTSVYETAQECFDYEDYVKKVRDSAKNANRYDLLDFISTEEGQKQLRSIYMMANRFDHDIAVLSNEKVSAKFQEKLAKAINTDEFRNLNAKAAIQYLQTNIETAELTNTQKEAWNNLINKLGHGTTRDIIVVLAMIFNNAMMNYKLPSINNNTTNNSYTKLAIE